ncbi:hypothetical protein DL762_004883 [Monosporascus cannonballus]|uniref:tRNA (uracil-O(2)-)-methyltransferase n=1 Tax=Monosporascus cannonballus TaxID=155416 RepID=A0ABY0H7M9_9PEZI|nr:hypothetical protein DL762_004883 [Monosporascus cannonballus]
MAFEPTELANGEPSFIEDLSGAQWVPLYRNPCTFGPTIFSRIMMNFIRNPNLNSSWLFRADILVEREPGHGESFEPASPESSSEAPPAPIIVHFKDFQLEKILVRKLIPRNTLRDNPMDQTCLIYHSSEPSEVERSLVVYKPHLGSQSDVPYYHPSVQGLAFLHEWNAGEDGGSISIHYHLFDNDSLSQRLVRTGLNLLSLLHKHGAGAKAGYQKRVQHDTIVPQAALQTTYARLKEKYARQLIETWAEVTDPSKHVFEDLGIAAFLIELWRQMYETHPFPGFVDIGCGNGLLVYILREEGYQGWGFDARQRKSWDNYNKSTVASNDSSPLRQHVLLPSVIQNSLDSPEKVSESLQGSTESEMIHNGLFPKGTFIISNHADELTPWTPILAAVSECPFIMIPCCSHDLSGARFRAPAPKGKGKSSSAYASLVGWVGNVARDCGWEIEKEMLRIPSTRNTGLIGRKRTDDGPSRDIEEIISKYGGTTGYVDNVMRLVKTPPRGH